MCKSWFGCQWQTIQSKIPFTKTRARQRFGVIGEKLKCEKPQYILNCCLVSDSVLQNSVFLPSIAQPFMQMQISMGIMLQLSVFFRINLSNSAFQKGETSGLPSEMFSSASKTNKKNNISVCFSHFALFSLSVHLKVSHLSVSECVYLFINLHRGWNSNKRSGCLTGTGRPRVVCEWVSLSYCALESLTPLSTRNMIASNHACDYHHPLLLCVCECVYVYYIIAL